ncbi:MAG: SPOR domain-containing protein [Moraxellaceae bacterium]|nr:SPOR domain-containing protein [Moraxellaceae bacterium]
MARAKTPAKPVRKKAQGASRNPAPRKTSKKSGAPSWLVLLVGLMFGLFVAFLIHLWNGRAEPAAGKDKPIAPIEEKQVTLTAKPAANTPPSAANGAGEEPRFDFYALLPNQEILPNKKTTEAASQAATKVKPAEQGDRTPYSLQAGSFRSEKEADRRRAEVLLLGLPVHTLKVSVKPGDDWYRVVVGPLKGKEALAAARGSLKANGVDTMIIK